jgi:WASH complex subunit strumpellin
LKDNNQELFDRRIQDNVDLIELDEAFKETYYEVIERFYHLFESIFTYYNSVTQYLSDINEGKYIEFTLEAIL